MQTGTVGADFVPVGDRRVLRTPPMIDLDDYRSSVAKLRQLCR